MRGYHPFDEDMIRLDLNGQYPNGGGGWFEEVHVEMPLKTIQRMVNKKNG